MNTHVRWIAASAGIALMLVAAAGCKSSSTQSSGNGTSTPTASTQATSTPTTTATTPAATSGGSLNGVPAACPSADEVMSNLHLTSLVVDGGDPSLCQYLFNGDKTKPYAVITFNAVPSFTPAMLESGLKKQQSGVTAVPGLADAAFSFTGSNGGFGLSFLSGGTICSIVTVVPTTVADEVSLARALLAG